MAEVSATSLLSRLVKILQRNTSQSGIFALGTSSHAYLEFDLQMGTIARALATAMADAREPLATVSGVNLVPDSGPNSAGIT